MGRNPHLLAQDSASDLGGTGIDVINGSIVRFQIAEDGRVLQHDIIRRITENTEHLACDRLPAAAGGQLYLADYHAVPDHGSCIRDARQALTRVAKATGVSGVVAGIDRIDGYLVPPLDGCADGISAVTRLEVDSDGGNILFSDEDTGGLYRLRPTSLPIMRATPLLPSDQFQIGPDGAVWYATTIVDGVSTRLSVYKIFPEQAAPGPLRLEDVTPCATYALPRNHTGSAVVTALAVGGAPGSPYEATLLISLADPNQPANALGIRGTVAVDSLAGAIQCTVTGFVTLRSFAGLRF